MARLRGSIRLGRLEPHGLKKLEADFCFQSNIGRETSLFIRSDRVSGVLGCIQSRFRSEMSVSKLPAFDRESGDLNVIIDTPKGSRNKFSWNEKGQLFELSGVLPAGAVFPYDFGFIPKTRGGDGDPLDVLVLMDEPAFTGCLVRSRLLGVIEAEQVEKGETERNDRLIAVAAKSRTQADLKSITDLNPKLVEEIEHFFVSYNEAKAKKFKPLGRYGPERARKLVLRSRPRSGGELSSRAAQTGTATKGGAPTSQSHVSHTKQLRRDPTKMRYLSRKRVSACGIPQRASPASG